MAENYRWIIKKNEKNQKRVIFPKQTKRQKRFFYGPSTKHTIEQQKDKKINSTKRTKITMVHESRSGGDDTKRFKKATASPTFHHHLSPLSANV